MSAKQGCDGGCGRVGINTVPGSSLLQAAPPRPLHFQKDGKELVPIQWKTVTTVGQTEAMSYKQWWKERRLA